MKVGPIMLAGQRSYVYLARERGGEPGNEATIMLPASLKVMFRGTTVSVGSLGWILLE